MPLRSVARATAAAAAVAIALTASLSATPAAAETITVRPGALERGSDPTVPVVTREVLVDRSLRIPVPTSSVLIGKSGDDYLVWTGDGARTPSIWRVQPDGDTALLLRTREAYGVVLSQDGDRLAVPHTRVQERRTRVTIHDARSAEVLQTTAFPGFATLLDFDDGRLALGATSPARTTVWQVATGDERRVNARAGYQADISADRLAFFTGDPYVGGCSVVTRLSAPAAALSKSCLERVTEFSPDGRRMAMVDLLTDGLGPNRVRVRTPRGREVATYDAPYFFGLVTWETSRALLLETSSRKRSALVRCVRSDCERASRLRSRPQLRSAATFKLPSVTTSRLAARP